MFVLFAIQILIASLVPAIFINIMGKKAAKLENINYLKSFIISILGTISFFVLILVISGLVWLISYIAAREALNNPESVIANITGLFGSFFNPVKMLMNLPQLIRFFINYQVALLILLCVFWITVSTAAHIFWAKVLLKTAILKSFITTIYIPISWIIGYLVAYGIINAALKSLF